MTPTTIECLSPGCGLVSTDTDYNNDWDAFGECPACRGTAARYTSETATASYVNGTLVTDEAVNDGSALEDHITHDYSSLAEGACRTCTVPFDTYLAKYPCGWLVMAE